MDVTATPVLAGGGQEIPPGTGGIGGDRLDHVVGIVERNWSLVLSVLMLLDAVLLLYMGRGLSFFYDDWDFVTHDYGGGIHSLLAGHGGNLVLFPVLVYKVLFHLVGLNHYAVFRLVVILLHLICGGLVFVLASRRGSRANALLAAALILFLGAAWEDLLWAFQMTYLLSVTGGLATWVLLERKGRWSEVGAMLCLALAIGSSSLGIALAFGVAVELLWQRRWRAGWIVIVPAILYAIWYLHYGESQITQNGLINGPGFAEDLAAAAFGGLVGRALEWGRPLALLGVLVVLRRLIRPVPISARLAGLLATGLGLWVITAVARSTISQPDTSRYVYLGAVVIVLTGVELLREVAIASRVTALATLLVGCFALTGLTILHAGAMSLRSTSKTVTAEMGALELAAAYAPPGYQPDPHLAPQIMAGPYLHTVRAIGSSPADTPPELVAADPASRAAADAVLVALGIPRLTPLGGTKPSSLAPAPTVSGLESARQVQHGACMDLTPLPGVAMSATLILPSGGVAIIDNGGAPVSLGYRRFGESFDPSSALVMPHSQAELSFMSDSAGVPWQLQVNSTSALAICGLAP
jgi:hypothetical protein